MEQVHQHRHRLVLFLFLSLTFALLHRLQQTLQLPLKVTLHLQWAGKDLEGELAIIIEELIIRFSLLEPLRLAELVLVASRSTKRTEREKKEEN